jgi:hypothetical protein
MESPRSNRSKTEKRLFGVHSSTRAPQAFARTAIGRTNEVFEMLHRADLSSYGIATLESQ